MILHNEFRLEKKLCNDYVSLLRSSHDNEFLEQKSDLKNQIKVISQRISAILQLDIPESEDLFRYGSFYVLDKLGQRENFLYEYMKQKIPDHPKDEYPEARKMRRHFVIHAGGTNSGKTYESLEALKKCEKGIYLAPLRLLALEIYEKLNMEHTRCNLETGEEEILVPGARHLSCTIEKAVYDKVFDVAVIDEGQLLSNRQRGSAWTRSILGILAKEIHICCALNAVPLITQLIEDCQDSYDTIFHERQTELIVEEKQFSFPDHVEPGDALIVFSRHMALRVASALDEVGKHASVIYGNLPPETRKTQVEQFASGQHQVVVATDAIGMGLNLPIRRIVFLETEKFDGIEHRRLTSQEIKQIAGRAGRRGIYDVGYVNAVSDKDFIRHALSQTDEEVNTAYILPSDELILNLPIGNILERLKTWSEHPISISYFDKADLSDLIYLYREIEDLESQLSEESLYRVIRIPFNCKDDELVIIWRRYVERLVRNETFLPPIVGSRMLSALENEYKAIDIYYSFCKNFRHPMDREWVSNNRNMISEKINAVLVKNIQSFQHICQFCGEKLPWNWIYRTCKECRD